jgi:hypothetical protein
MGLINARSGLSPRRLPFLDLGVPAAVDAALDRLVGRALLGVDLQQPAGLPSIN